MAFFLDLGIFLLKDGVIKVFYFGIKIAKLICKGRLDTLFFHVLYQRAKQRGYKMHSN